MGRALAAVEHAPALIGGAALRPDPDPLSHAALARFVSILGAEAGDLALKVLSLGGVYLAGGIPPRILPALRDDAFFSAFTAKGRMAGLLGRMPISVLTLEAALLGAALRGLELAKVPRREILRCAQNDNAALRMTTPTWTPSHRLSLAGYQIPSTFTVCS